MKNKYLIGLFLVIFFVLPFVSEADTLANRFKGRILLQVESNGEAWYVNADNGQRYFMGRPADAFQLMRDLGIGITNADFDSFNIKVPIRLAGKILLKVQDKGQAYYVNPVDLKMYYLGRPADAFAVMRKLGLGITNSNLKMIAIKTGYDVKIIPTIPAAGTIATSTPVKPEIPVVVVIPGNENVATSTVVATSSPVIATSTTEVLPTCDFTADYFNNMTLTGYSKLTQIETGIDHEWWTGKPAGFNYADEFSVRWNGDCDFLPGKYKFTAVFDDGVRVYVDDQLIIDSWEKRFDTATVEANLDLTAGKHKVKVEYFEYRLNAQVKVDWKKI